MYIRNLRMQKNSKKLKKLKKTKHKKLKNTETITELTKLNILSFPYEFPFAIYIGILRLKKTKQIKKKTQLKQYNLRNTRKKHSLLTIFLKFIEITYDFIQISEYFC